MSEKLQVLIVDDSRIFRSALEEALKGDESFEVAGSVWNGVKAIEYIEKTPPDLVTLDVEMPEMDGLATLQAIQEINRKSPGRSIGVIMVSSHTHTGAESTIKALEAGAFDFVKKPEGVSAVASIKTLRELLAPRIRDFALKSKKGSLPRRAVGTTTPPAVRKESVLPRKIIRPGAKEVVVIGVSTGGPKALVQMLPELCDVVDVPILIVQHMPPLFTKSLADSLNSKCSSTVVEASMDERVQKNHVYIAPGGQHMLVRRNDQREVVITLNAQPPENGCRPSVDVLFRSAAMVYQKHVVAIILTGMGSDGTKGIAPLKRAGAPVIVQDEATSVVWGMPGSAVASGLVDKVAPIDRIAKTVKTII